MCFGDGPLEVGCGFVAICSFGDDVAERYVFVWVGEFEKIVPVFLVEFGCRAEDEDPLFVCDWVRR